MHAHKRHVRGLAAFALAAITGVQTMAQDGTRRSQDRGNGFVEHGVAVPVCRARGVAATVDGEGKPAILVWLADYRGTRGLLMLDAATGQGVTYDVPAPEGDSPFAVLLSSRNRFYSLFADHLLEFDPASRAFTFVGKGAGRVAHVHHRAPRASSAATYEQPPCILQPNHPRDGQLWPDQQRELAAVPKLPGGGRHGVGLRQHRQRAQPGHRLRPALGQAHPLGRTASARPAPAWSSAGRRRSLRRPHSGGPWYILSGGQATPTAKPTVARAPSARAARRWSWAGFPDGQRIQRIHCPKWVEIRATDGSVRRLTFDATPRRARTCDPLVCGPDGRIYGCAGHPAALCLRPGYRPLHAPWLAPGEWPPECSCSAAWAPLRCALYARRLSL